MFMVKTTFTHRLFIWCNWKPSSPFISDRENGIKKVIKSCVVKSQRQFRHCSLYSGNWKPRGSRSRRSKTLNGRRLRENVTRGCTRLCVSPDCRRVKYSAPVVPGNGEIPLGFLTSSRKVALSSTLISCQSELSHKRAVAKVCACTELRLAWWSSFPTKLSWTCVMGFKKIVAVHENNENKNVHCKRFLLDKTGYDRLVRQMHKNAFRNFGSRTGSCWSIRPRSGSKVNWTTLTFQRDGGFILFND